MNRYYRDRLSAARLRRCYEIAPPRVRQYLSAEIDFVQERTRSASVILELGCGYGRLLQRLARPGRTVVGIDTSLASLRLATRWLRPAGSVLLAGMDAARLGLPDNCMEAIGCIQNGISAFHTSPRRLLAEAVRVTRPGGSLLFSSYTESFWEPRLEWFRRQAAAGLLGEIDEAQTGNGVIVCRDGFRATTFGRADFRAAAAGLPVEMELVDVDGSSLFCVMRKREAP